MLDQRALAPGLEAVPVRPVIVALVCHQRLELLQIPLSDLWPDLGVVYMIISPGLLQSLEKVQTVEYKVMGS